MLEYARNVPKPKVKKIKDPQENESKNVRRTERYMGLKKKQGHGSNKKQNTIPSTSEGDSMIEEMKRRHEMEKQMAYGGSRQGTRDLEPQRQGTRDLTNHSGDRRHSEAADSGEETPKP